MTDEQYQHLTARLDDHRDMLRRMQRTLEGDGGVLTKLAEVRVEQRWIKTTLYSSLTALITSVASFLRFH